MSRDDLAIKFDQLDSRAQGQLLAFWESLLARTDGALSDKDPAGVMTESYRNLIQDVSVWTEEETQVFDEAASGWSWPVEEW